MIETGPKIDTPPRYLNNSPDRYNSRNSYSGNDRNRSQSRYGSQNRTYSQDRNRSQSRQRYNNSTYTREQRHYDDHEKAIRYGWKPYQPYQNRSNSQTRYDNNSRPNSRGPSNYTNNYQKPKQGPTLNSHDHSQVNINQGVCKFCHSEFKHDYKDCFVVKQASEALKAEN